MTLEEQYEQLSPNGKAYLRAMKRFMEITYPKPTPGPELFEATREVEHLRVDMSEEEGKAVSSYAHRRDYPDMYDDDGNALRIN